MEHASDENSLIRKLALTWHLSVPERRRLPNDCAKASLLTDAIENELRARGWYPAGAKPDDDSPGGLIELTPEGACRIYWKTRVSFSQVEVSEITEHHTSREAAETLLRSLFGTNIDGIPIDWQS